MITIRRFSFSKNITRITLLLAFFLSGCQILHHRDKPAASSVPVIPPIQSEISQNPTAMSQNRPAPLHNEKYDAESEKLKQCQSQLEALKTMNPEKYKRLHTSFDYLMNGAAQYTVIRQNTNVDTQDTVDALYRYRANLLCSQIAQALLDSLTSRGEARP